MKMSKKYIVLSMVLASISIFFTSYFLLPTTALAQEIDILWQGNTYTPPFYKGRSLWTNQSQLVLLAIPTIPGVVNTSNLNYKWTKNGAVLGTASGTGRNTLIFSDSILSKPQTTKLEILSSEGAILASKTLTLVPSSPDILIYENNPLYGLLFHREVGGEYNMREKEITFTTFPLFFSISSRSSATVDYAWRTNTDDSKARSSITYRTPDDTAGFSSVTVKASNNNKLIQSFERSFVVNFGQR